MDSIPALPRSAALLAIIAIVHRWTSEVSYKRSMAIQQQSVIEMAKAKGKLRGYQPVHMA